MDPGRRHETLSSETKDLLLMAEQGVGAWGCVSPPSPSSPIRQGNDPGRCCTYSRLCHSWDPVTLGNHIFLKGLQGNMPNPCPNRISDFIILDSKHLSCAPEEDTISMFGVHISLKRQPRTRVIAGRAETWGSHGELSLNNVKSQNPKCNIFLNLSKMIPIDLINTIPQPKNMRILPDFIFSKLRYSYGLIPGNWTLSV